MARDVDMRVGSAADAVPVSCPVAGGDRPATRGGDVADGIVRRHRCAEGDRGGWEPTVAGHRAAAREGRTRDVAAGEGEHGAEGRPGLGDDAEGGGERSDEDRIVGAVLVEVRHPRAEGLAACVAASVVAREDARPHPAEEFVLSAEVAGWEE